MNARAVQTLHDMLLLAHLLQLRLAHAPLQTHAQQLLRLDRELHRQLRNTSLQKPLTIMLTASSADRPRCLQ